MTLADIGATARGALQALDPKLAKQIPADADARILEFEIPSIVSAAVDLRELPWILLALAVLCGAGALSFSRDRRLTPVVFGFAITIGGVVCIVAMSAIRAHVLSDIDAGGSRDAAAVIWSALLGDLHTALLLVALTGAVITAAASLLLRTFEIRAPLDWLRDRVVTVPEGDLGRAVRAIVLTLVGIAIVLDPASFINLVAVLIGLFIAYAGVSELIRLTVADPGDTSQAETRGRTTLIAGVVGAIGILGAGAIFVGVGGTTEDPAPVVTEGCNGSDGLCDASFDTVALPSTHNSMSGATYSGYLFAQQEQGISGQLHDGVRGSLIDAHYGMPTESGTVKTDFSSVSSGDKGKLEEEIGPEALAAAQRIRDRIISSPASGPRQVYFCHGFCEVGAVPIDTIFGEYRDFLATNPDEVVAVVIEDYVSPGSIAAAMKRTGLIDYVYRGDVTRPWPTLGDMVESGGWLVMMAENDAGGGTIPWYHEAYDGIVQETPYSFKEPSDLTDPANLPASCDPNRGGPGSPIFLLNNWIDTTPAPHPSNAAKVNAHDALLERVRVCQKQRKARINLVAVDFYGEGDVFGVARELNEERTGAATP